TWSPTSGMNQEPRLPPVISVATGAHTSGAAPPSARRSRRTRTRPWPFSSSKALTTWPVVTPYRTVNRKVPSGQVQPGAETRRVTTAADRMGGLGYVPRSVEPPAEAGQLDPAAGPQAGHANHRARPCDQALQLLAEDLRGQRLRFLFGVHRPVANALCA